MESEGSHKWGFLCAYFDLAVAFFSLSASTMAFLMTKFLGFCGLRLFGVPPNGIFKLQKLLFDFACEKVLSTVRLSSRQLVNGRNTRTIRGSEDLEMEAKIRLLEKALKEEKIARAALYADLEKERSAAATAAEEAMAMISRLQDEKAFVEMEARQCQRMIKERAAYEAGEMAILKEILVRREMEKFFLEKEVEAYKRQMETFVGKNEQFSCDRDDNENTNKDIDECLSKLSCEGDEDEEEDEVSPTVSEIRNLKLNNRRYGN